MPARLALLQFLHQRVLLAVLADMFAVMFDGVLEVAVDGTHHYATFRNGLRARRHALQSAGFFEALPWKVQ